MPAPNATAQIAVAATIGATTVTGSVTFNTGACYIVVVYLHHATVAFTDTTTVTGMGLTWTKLGTVRGGSVPNNEILTVFAGHGAGSTGAITITPSQTPAAGRVVVLEQLTAPGSGLSAPFSSHVNTNSGTGTTGTVTVTGLDQVGGKVFTFFGHRINEVASPEAGWVEHTDLGTTTAALETQEFKGSDPGGSATWATSSSWLALGAEMKNASYAAVIDDIAPVWAKTTTRVGNMQDEDEAVWALV
jgi:hypothetical protein